jgi:hypothetical protein
MSIIIYLVLIAIVVRCNMYPKMLSSSNNGIAYYALDYHSSLGIVLGGYCNDTSLCGINAPNAIIEVFNPTTMTVLW